MAQYRPGASVLDVVPSAELPAWKSWVSHLFALASAILFITAGVWKIANPYQWSTMLEQLQVWHSVSLPFTLGLSIVETLAGVMILVPRFRRWGAWLVGALLVVFMIYVGWNYSTLVGKDCSCFPWVKRTVGPGFFIGDAVMLAMAGIAGWWAQPSNGLRNALVVLGSVAVFAGVMFGVATVQQTGTRAPESVIADGQPFALGEGRVLVYFYDPMCMHCDQAARAMAKYPWKSDVRIVVVPTKDQQFAAAFLRDTGLRAATTLEQDRLRQVFEFRDPPYGVALQDGRQVASLRTFNAEEPLAELRRLGWVE